MALHYCGKSKNPILGIAMTHWGQWHLQWNTQERSISAMFASYETLWNWKNRRVEQFPTLGFCLTAQGLTDSQKQRENGISRLSWRNYGEKFSPAIWIVKQLYWTCLVSGRFRTVTSSRCLDQTASTEQGFSDSACSHAAAPGVGTSWT